MEIVKAFLTIFVVVPALIGGPIVVIDYVTSDHSPTQQHGPLTPEQIDQLNEENAPNCIMGQGGLYC